MCRHCLVAHRFGVQASLASVPAVSAVLSATAAAPRPVLPIPAAATAAVRPLLGVGGGPRPLLLDAAGREVDEHGNVIERVKLPVANSLVSLFHIRLFSRLLLYASSSSRSSRLAAAA